MCLIIEKPAGQTVPKWIIESAAEWNSDGFGIMHNGTFDKWKKISVAKLKKRIDALTDETAAIHFRYATHGDVNRRNAHPFKLRDGSLLMHNGIIPGHGAKTGKSDTAEFVERILNPLAGVAKRSELLDVMDKHGGGSRFAYMDTSGNIHRVGKWTAYEGLTFSNTSMWDYPSNNYFKTTSFDYDDDDGFDQWTADDENQLIGEYVRETLFTYCDYIEPDERLVEYSDLTMFDDMMSGNMDMIDFVACCRPSTALALYRELVRREALPRAVSW